MSCVVFVVNYAPRLLKHKAQCKCSQQEKAAKRGRRQEVNP